MKYGCPYQGGKNSIAEWVVSYIPSAPALYDLFAGGCGITHRAMIEGRWGKYVINDRFSLATKLFHECAKGNVPKPRWVSREEFFRDKDADPFTAVCWSFGNDCQTYLFGRDIEQRKRAIFNAVVSLDFKEADALGINLHCIEKGTDWRKRRRLLKKVFGGERSGGLERLERLERLQSLESLERLERLERDYSDIDVPADAVIYCDPPYKGTAGYAGVKFDHDKFYDWCRKQIALTIISEYDMPEDFFCIAKKVKAVSLAAVSTMYATECLFVPGHQRELYNSMRTTLF